MGKLRKTIPSVESKREEGSGGEKGENGAGRQKRRWKSVEERLK